MNQKKEELKAEDVSKASGGIKGFPDGEYTDGNVVCPFCSSTKIGCYETFKVDSFHSNWTDAVVPDKTVECYICAGCHGQFVHYGNFFEVVSRGVK